MRLACSTNQLKNLGELPLTVVHLNKISGTPFSRMKELAKLKLQPGLLEYLLFYWVQEGGGSNFKLGSHQCLSV